MRAGTTSILRRLGLVLTLMLALATPVDAATVSMQGLHAVGNQIRNGAGQNLFLHGVNVSGSEFECIHGSGNTLAGSGKWIKALKAWNINVVRLPLNEHCWLGINGDASNAAQMGAAYRKAVVDTVKLLTSRQNNLAVILDLHWSAAGTTLASGQQPMPDADHAPAFWDSVARTFAGNGAVIFDLFNEPYPNFTYVAESPDGAWQCWLQGGGSCTDPKIGYTAVGMQSLVDTVRKTGAGNLMMVGGLQYANELSQWLRFRPSDPGHNLAAAWHAYSPDNYCSNRDCWNRYVAPVMAQVPVITGEYGVKPKADGSCDTAALADFWDFVESHQQGHLAWVFSLFGGDCEKAFNWALISDDSGTATRYGQAFISHLQTLPERYP